MICTYGASRSSIVIMSSLMSQRTSCSASLASHRSTRRDAKVCHIKLVSCIVSHMEPVASGRWPVTKHCHAAPSRQAGARAIASSRNRMLSGQGHGTVPVGRDGPVPVGRDSLRVVPVAALWSGDGTRLPVPERDGTATCSTGGSQAAGGAHARRAPDRALGWLRGAMLALAVLAAAAAVVSWDAQYVLVRSVKHNPAVAAMEAGIPDIGALIFATLGIALALHGRRAVRARALNVACVGISLSMNALAATPGWADLAIWVMPSAVYALASDTLIGVVRAWGMTRSRLGGDLAAADDEATPMAIIGGLVLWLIRLGIAPLSTIAGFRRWVLDECPVAPGRKAPARRSARRRGQAAPALASARPAPAGQRTAAPGKQARLLTLAGQRHDLARSEERRVGKE